MSVFIDSARIAPSMPISSGLPLEDSSLKPIVDAIHTIMLPQFRLESDRQLEYEEAKEYTARFITSIKDNSIDLAQFFPEDKRDEAHSLLQQFATRFENEMEESKIQKEAIQREIDQLEKEIAEDNEKIARHDEKIARHDEKIAQIRKNRLAILATHFYSIFNKEVLSPDRTDEIFDTYLADGSLTVELNSEDKYRSKINTMTSVIRYLCDNPKVKACDFRVFETNINDLSTFTEHLKTPAAYSIKGVAFKANISDVAKAVLAEAAGVRATAGFPLKVQYFA